MWGLCYYYAVELHNFAPNAILQAATFITVCEGFLGIPAQWGLWIYLFRGELFTMPTGSKGKRRPVRAGGLTFALRERGNDMYPACNMTTNNSDGDKGWFYHRNNDAGLPPCTGKVLTDRPLSWAFGVSDSEL
jgi:hypothetical protein